MSLLLTATAQATDPRNYQVKLSIPATQNLLQQFETRGEAIPPQLACGRELKVLGDLALMREDSDIQPSENFAAIDPLRKVRKTRVSRLSERSSIPNPGACTR